MNGISSKLFNPALWQATFSVNLPVTELAPATSLKLPAEDFAWMTSAIDVDTLPTDAIEDIKPLPVVRDENALQAGAGPISSLISGTKLFATSSPLQLSGNEETAETSSVVAPLPHVVSAFNGHPLFAKADAERKSAEDFLKQALAHAEIGTPSRKTARLLQSAQNAFARAVAIENAVINGLVMSALEKRDLNDKAGYLAALKAADAAFRNRIERDRVLLEEPSGRDLPTFGARFKNKLGKIEKLRDERLAYLKLNDFFAKMRGKMNVPEEFKDVPAALPIRHIDNGNVTVETKKDFDGKMKDNDLASVYVPFWGSGEARGTRVILPLHAEEVLKATGKSLVVVPGATTVSSSALSSVNAATSLDREKGKWKSLVLTFDQPFHGAGSRHDEMKLMDNYLSSIIDPLAALKDVAKETTGGKFIFDYYGRSLGANLGLELGMRTNNLFDSITAISPFSPAEDWRRKIIVYSNDPDKKDMFKTNEVGFAWANDPVTGMRKQWTWPNGPRHGQEKQTKILVLFGDFEDTYPNENFAFQDAQDFPNLPFSKIWWEMAKRYPFVTTVAIPSNHYVVYPSDKTATEQALHLVQAHRKNPEATPALAASMTEEIRALADARKLKDKTLRAYWDRLTAPIQSIPAKERTPEQTDLLQQHKALIADNEFYSTYFPQEEFEKLLNEVHASGDVAVEYHLLHDQYGDYRPTKRKKKKPEISQTHEVLAALYADVAKRASRAGNTLINRDARIQQASLLMALNRHGEADEITLDILRELLPTTGSTSIENERLALRLFHAFFRDLSQRARENQTTGPDWNQRGLALAVDEIRERLRGVRFMRGEFRTLQSEWYGRFLQDGKSLLTQNTIAKNKEKKHAT